MKQVTFNEKLESLVDLAGEKYGGKRGSVIN